jgi:hypothetical protein
MNIETRFDIIPYWGAKPIKFGMMVSEVEATLCAPDSISKNILGQRVEFREYMNVAYTMDEWAIPRVSHIGFGREMKCIFHGDTNIFFENPTDVLIKLMAFDNEPMLYLGFLVFFKLGISLTGFHDNDFSQKAIAMFKKGEWDKSLKKMSKFTLTSP